MNAILALKEALPHLVIDQGSQEYNATNDSYFTLFASDLKPAIIAQPSSASEVSQILHTISPYRKENMTRLAVRGTGHTPFAGSANITDGITIDLRKMKRIKISETESTVCIGVGETWGSIYDAPEKHGLTTAGGRVGRVGVGGLVLGGEKCFRNVRLTSDMMQEDCRFTPPVTALLATQSLISRLSLHPERLFMPTRVSIPTSGRR